MRLSGELPGSATPATAGSGHEKACPLAWAGLEGGEGRIGSAVLFAGRRVDDLEVLDVVARVGAEGQLHAVQAFHPDQEVRVLAPQALEDARVDQDAQGVVLAVLAQLEAAGHGGETALELDRHGGRRLHDAAAAAVRAV